MISLVFIIILLWQFYLGYSRGILLQGLYTFGALISFLVAKGFYLSLAKKISLWIPYSNPAEGVSVYFFKSVNIFALDNVYYAGVAFIFLTLTTYMVFRLIGIFAHLAPIDQFDEPKWNIISGFFSSLICLFFIAMVFIAFATVPIAGIQSYLTNHFITRFLIDGLPLFSKLIQHLWMLAL